MRRRILNSRYIWFRPLLPCTLLGGLYGWLPGVNGTTVTEANEAIWGAVAGFIVGLFLDRLVHKDQ